MSATTTEDRYWLRVEAAALAAWAGLIARDRNKRPAGDFVVAAIRGARTFVDSVDAARRTAEEKR